MKGTSVQARCVQQGLLEVNCLVFYCRYTKETAKKQQRNSKEIAKKQQRNSKAVPSQVPRKYEEVSKNWPRNGK